ncbi:MAG: Uncharacterised protein [Flavobacteriia bacterium]|nr:MAG: Uncharacterised protein [Flavobacteriia bacterium]
MLEKQVCVDGISALRQVSIGGNGNGIVEGGTGTVAVSVDDDLNGIQTVAQTFIAHLSAHQVRRTEGGTRKDKCAKNK